MSGHCDAKMMIPVLLCLCLSTLVCSRPVSLFELSFAEVPQKRIQTDFLGATPANTFPLVIRPLNFAPAVVAPSPFSIGSPIRFPSSITKGAIPGALPLFSPFKHFPYLQYVPVRTSFYLAEPNVRNPFAKFEPDDIPSKVAAPGISFSPIHDTQVFRAPSKNDVLKGFEIPQEAHPKMPVKPITSNRQQMVRVAHFPTEVGNSEFSLRDDDSDLRFSAPGGIVKSTQPSFTYTPFRNSKVSSHLMNPLSTTLDFRNSDGNNPTIVEF